MSLCCWGWFTLYQEVNYQQHKKGPDVPVEIPLERSHINNDKTSIDIPHKVSVIVLYGIHHDW